MEGSKNILRCFCTSIFVEIGRTEELCVIFKTLKVRCLGNAYWVSHFKATLKNWSEDRVTNGVQNFYGLKKKKTG